MTTERNIMKFPEKSPYHPETAADIFKAWSAFSNGLNDPQWLAEMRSVGRAYVTARGLPTPKMEGWKYTNIIPLVRGLGDRQGVTNVTSNTIPGIDVMPLTKSIEQNPWVRDMIAGGIPGTDHNADPLLAHLSNVYFRDGVSIDVPANKQVSEPLHIVLECEGDVFYMVHTAIRIGANASLTIIEDHRSTGHFWKNRMSHIVLEPGAKLTHVRVQEDSMESVYTQNTNVTVGKDATYDAVALYTGAALSRNQVRVVLDQPGAACHINSASLMRGTQHTDTTVLIEHKAPHCQSKQNIRTILDDRAHGVFQGKVHVHQPAQKTDGYQLSKALILSEGAEMDTKPELEIYADDVKCSHGATTGRLDDEPMFYMQSRGIPKDEARALLIESFAAEILDLIVDDDIRERLSGKVRDWLRYA